MGQLVELNPSVCGWPVHEPELSPGFEFIGLECLAVFRTLGQKCGAAPSSRDRFGHTLADPAIRRIRVRVRQAIPG